MICDGLDEISIDGIEFMQSYGKINLILSWITYLSSIFNSDSKSVEEILIKVQYHMIYSKKFILEMER